MRECTWERDERCVSGLRRVRVQNPLRRRPSARISTEWAHLANDQECTSSISRRKKAATTLSVTRKACTVGCQPAVPRRSFCRVTTHPCRHAEVDNFLFKTVWISSCSEVVSRRLELTRPLRPAPSSEGHTRSATAAIMPIVPRTTPLFILAAV